MGPPVRVMAVIPSRYEPARLRTMARPLVDEATVVVLDNGHDTPPVIPGVRVVDSRGLGIYAMWNRGWASARHESFDAIALLNDDITILPGTLTRLAEILGADPTLGVVSPDKYAASWSLPERTELDVIRDPERERSLAGFAFVARLSMFPYPPFDEGYMWWFGDDAFDRKVRQAGYGVARVIGLPIEHESDSEANGWARRPELRKFVQQDLARWAAMS